MPYFHGAYAGEKCVKNNIVSFFLYWDAWTLEWKFKLKFDGRGGLNCNKKSKFIKKVA